MLNISKYKSDKQNLEDTMQTYNRQLKELKINNSQLIAQNNNLEQSNKQKDLDAQHLRDNTKRLREAILSWKEKFNQQQKENQFIKQDLAKVNDEADQLCQQREDNHSEVHHLVEELSQIKRRKIYCIICND